MQDVVYTLDERTQVYPIKVEGTAGINLHSVVTKPLVSQPNCLYWAFFGILRVYCATPPFRRSTLPPAPPVSPLFKTLSYLETFCLTILSLQRRDKQGDRRR